MAAGEIKIFYVAVAIMTDVVSPEKRSQIMAGISSTDTGPEIKVRKWLHAHGFRFRLHRRNLPGTPDIVLSKHRTVIFVHGCFWHQHQNCRIAKIPATRTEWWREKFNKNAERDEAARMALESLGWKVLVIWECEVRNGAFATRLEEFFLTVCK